MQGQIDWNALLKLTLILLVWGVICGLFIPYPYRWVAAPLGGLIIGWVGGLWWRPE